MKAAPLLVSWHNENAPIYSAHFEPHGKGRLATAGGDNNVRVYNYKSTGVLDIADIGTAMERREPRRGAQDYLSLNAREAHPGCQRSSMVSTRYIKLDVFRKQLLTHDR